MKITTKPAQANIMYNVVIHLFDPNKNKPAPCENDPAFSEDICIIDENGLSGVACFAFEDDRWVFHFDTLEEYQERNAQVKWKWYYPPVSKEDIEW